MADENGVLERSQAGADPSLLKTLVGKPRQIIVDTSTLRPHIMDGVKAGGKPLAFKQEVDGVKQEVETALKELIVEYGGTVPTE